ncbi:hypothetical protein BOX15_Mlig018201g1 [Macrostomum lignano]|uniref:BZIP domain-containing protein n=2 Tax=Macrostomum lignano TaxID=282301 RepID=A0A267EQN1_9PLAT|nr:hypothetical protein BOX15_Mlig018201g1 [Macrostomum lignano]
MASAVAQPAAPPAAASDDDVLHLLFNQADGILACDQPPAAGVPQIDLLGDSAFDPLPDLSLQSQPSPPDSQGSGGGGSSSGFASFTGGGSSAGGSGENLLNFDLDSFLSGAEALDHASYELGPLPDPTGHSPGGPLRGGSGAGGGGGVAAGGGVSGGKRRKRQLAQLPYSIGDLEDDDLALYSGGGGGGIWDDAEDDDGLESGGGIGAKPEGQPGEPLLLTAEEQRVARQLGAVLPSHFPLTREELQILRTVRRKIRNKISAKNSRAKKQEYVRGLELRVKGSAAENAALRDRCTGLEQQNRRLLGAVRRLQAFLRSSGLSLTSTAGKATGTGLFILCLSFALFLTPQLGPLLVAGPGAPGVADPSTAVAGPRPATGRRILAASPENAAAAAADVAAVVAEKSAAVDSPGAGVAGAGGADSIAAAAVNQSDVSASADSIPDVDGSVASSTSPPASPMSSSSPQQSPYYYYYGGGGGGEDDAPPREQDLADRDL